nr:glycosyltransferase [Bacteroidota bacterium]
LKIVLEKTKYKVRAFIVGDGESRVSIELLAKQAGIDFTDFTQDTRKAPLTFTSWLKNIDWVNAGLDIVALTSLNEGTPVSLIEAQAAGKPIVSTAVGGIEDVVIPGITAILSEKEDKEGLANNLLLLTEDAGKRLAMSGAGIEFVNSKFQYTRLVSDMSSYYKELIALGKAESFSLINK